jgi:hypothetical protein
VPPARPAAKTDADIQHVAASSGGGTSPPEHVAEDKKLLDAGTMTQAEFDQLNANALAGGPGKRRRRGQRRSAESGPRLI